MEFPQTLTAENFDATIQQADRPLFVAFWASWSTASLMNDNFLKATDELIGHRIYLTTIDISVEPLITERFGIITVPTLLVFWKGELVKQYIGIQEPTVYKEYVDLLLGKDPYDDIPVSDGS